MLSCRRCKNDNFHEYPLAGDYVNIFFISFLKPKVLPVKTFISKVLPGCVEILVGGRLDGSGVIVDKNGSVLTALHVIRKKPENI